MPFRMTEWLSRKYPRRGTTLSRRFAAAGRGVRAGAGRAGERRRLAVRLQVVGAPLVHLAPVGQALDVTADLNRQARGEIAVGDASRQGRAAQPRGREGRVEGVAGADRVHGTHRQCGAVVATTFAEAEGAVG